MIITDGRAEAILKSWQSAVPIATTSFANTKKMALAHSNGFILIASSALIQTATNYDALSAVHWSAPKCFTKKKKD